MGNALLSVAAFLLAYLLDIAIGDPPRRTHPVRLLGAVIAFCDRSARRLTVSRLGLKVAGALTLIFIAGGATALTLMLLRAAYSFHPLPGFALEVYILFTVLAGGDLKRHVQKVENGLRAGNLKEARLSVAMLVSRSTGSLDQGGISRAALESLFENSADGLIAPLFYAAIGGPALAVLYKAVNTMDSMLGYKNEKYLHLGFFPARADDLLSYLPARLTAGFILAAGLIRGAFRQGLKVLRADYNKHDSPNSAWPEAAAAGVLGLRFGGPDSYEGAIIERPLINAGGSEPLSGDISKGLALFRDSSLLAFIFFMPVVYWLRTWEAWPF